MSTVRATTVQMHVRTNLAPGGNCIVSWVTDVLRREHWVTDDALTLGKIVGTYVGICGQEFLPASLTEPPQGRCVVCVKSHLFP